jgi:hypothetical protein
MAGTYCFDEPWSESPYDWAYAQQFNWNIWYWCNNGGPNVIYIDSWQYAWLGNGWFGGAWRPATSHYHYTTP